MKSVIKLFSVLFLVGGVAFVSCKKPEDPKKDPNNPDNWKDPTSEFYRPPVTGVTLSETDTLFVEVGGTATLTAKIVPDNAYVKDVTWESSDESIATVDQTGIVKAVKVGNCKITVRTKENNLTASRVVVVVPIIKDYYTIGAIAGVFNKQTSQITTTGSTITTTATPPFTFGSGNVGGLVGYALVGAATNTSGEIIPAGTPVKYRLKLNDTIMKFRASDGSTITELSGNVTADIAIGSTFLLYAFDEFKGITVDALGKQTFCIEVLQVGKKAYAVPFSGCGDYTIAQ